MSLNAHHCWGIITDDYNKVEDLYDSLTRQYPNETRRVPSGIYIGRTFVKWLRPSGAENCRGYRFHRAWIDRSCFEQYADGYYATLLLYCERLEDLIWI